MVSANVFVDTEDVSLPSAVRTTSGQAAGVLTGAGHTVRAFLDVTAASGTAPSMTLTLETSHDGTTWSAVAAFTAKTAVSTERKVFVGLNKHIRWSWAITGTGPSLTFSCTADLVGA